MRLALIVLACGSAAALAQEPTEAERLFREGRDLLTAGKPDEACAKFELSIKKDPRAVGTLLNLALCNERRGKVATAFSLYQEAFDRAKEAGLDGQREAAQQSIAKLAAQVPIVTIKIAKPSTGETVFIDDKRVERDVEVAIDPGSHKLVATAPGLVAHEQTFVVAVSEKRTIDVPELRSEQTIVRGSSPVPRVVLFSGLGLVALAAGMATYAYVDYNAQFPDHCGGDRPKIDGRDACDATGQKHVDRARTLATVSSIVGVVGLAATGTGIYLTLRARKRESRGVTIVPTSNGIAAFGTF